MKKYLAILSVVLLTGCASGVVQTRFNYDTNGLTLISPKDVTFDSLVASDAHGSKLAIKGYASSANAAALAATTAQTALTTQLISALAAQAVAGSGHTPVPIPPPVTTEGSITTSTIVKP